MFGSFLVFYIPLSREASVNQALIYKEAIKNYIGYFTDGDTCANASLSSNMTIPNDLPFNATFLISNCSYVQGNVCTVFGALSMYARVFGYLNGPAMRNMLSSWVSVQVVLVLNFLPARILFLGVPLAIVILICVVGMILNKGSLTNLGGTIPFAFDCSPQMQGSVSNFFFTVISFMVCGCLALLLQSISRSRLKRELFFWTKKLDVCRMQSFVSYIT